MKPMKNKEIDASIVIILHTHSYVTIHNGNAYLIWC